MPRVTTFELMTAAFFAALAVAVIAVLALIAALRRRASAARRAQAEVDKAAAELAGVRRELEEAAAGLAAARTEAADARAESSAAHAAAEQAGQLTADAERRAQALQAEILRAEAAAAERRAAAAVTPGVGAALWQLERLRCEREWSEIVGPGEGLPVEWDETLGAVLATEMAIIREVIGTPGQVERPADPALSDLPCAAATVRLGVELLRTLARSGEEMAVTVSDDGVTVDQVVLGPVTAGGLEALQTVARAAGTELTVDLDGPRLVARLALPLGTSGHRS